MPTSIPVIMPVCVADHVQSNEYCHTVFAAAGLEIALTYFSARSSIGSFTVTACSSFIVIFAVVLIYLSCGFVESPVKPMSFSHVSIGKFSGVALARNAYSASVHSVAERYVGMSYVQSPDAQPLTVVTVHCPPAYGAASDAELLSHAWNSRIGQRISPGRMSLPNSHAFSLHVQLSSSVTPRASRPARRRRSGRTRRRT